ncbi:MAG: hypothetical protein SGJ18_02195 [Pseudomonadota bacterium]|nr:hypothetical protein [Pseudomonadota bacterium]
MDQNVETQKHNDKFYRFQVFQGERDASGKMKKTKSVGMAYLKDGQSMLTLRLWTLVSERFYLILNKNDASKYLVMTREPNKNPLGKNKYFWNIVGNGVIDTTQGLVTIEFDLLDKPIFMSTHPESSAYSVSLPKPEDVIPDAA